MRKPNWVAVYRISSLLGISLAAGIGLVSFGYAQNAHHSHKNDKSDPAHPNASKLDQRNKYRVAIIGSGIGGSSAAYFISNSLDGRVDIDVFEKSSKVGGRMAVLELDGEFYEAGGAVIHESNKYMNDFCEFLGLEKINKGDFNQMGIYNGEDFVFLSSGYSLVDKFKLLWRYGLSLIRMGRFSTKTLDTFLNIYKKQDDGESFESVPDLLSSLGGKEFIESTRTSSRGILSKNGISDRTIDELATAVSRCNYGQDLSINAFTGFVSLAGAQSGKLWAVKGGNYQICRGILDKSGVNLKLNSKVHAIKKKSTEGKGVKYSLDVNGQASGFIYDIVVVAVPLEIKSSFIPCDSCKNWPKFEELGHYQQTVATFVKGELNHTAFGFAKASEVPDEIFTVENPKLSFSSIGLQRNVENMKAPKGQKSVYKVFSREVLTNEQLNHFFTEREKEARITWLAYPHYAPPENFTSFRLDDGVFYANAIERAASAMEMGAIGGRNAALLALKSLQSTEILDEIKTTNVKGEL